VADKEGRDFIVEECSRDAIDTVHNLNTLVGLALASLGQVTLKRGGAILMRLGGLAIEGIELCSDDLEEVLEHVFCLVGLEIFNSSVLWTLIRREITHSCANTVQRVLVETKPLPQSLGRL
jgi:hypothetical protein